MKKFKYGGHLGRHLGIDYVTDNCRSHLVIALMFLCKKNTYFEGYVDIMPCQQVKISKCLNFAAILGAILELSI